MHHRPVRKTTTFFKILQHFCELITAHTQHNATTVNFQGHSKSNRGASVNRLCFCVCSQQEVNTITEQGSLLSRGVFLPNI